MTISIYKQHEFQYEDSSSSSRHTFSYLTSSSISVLLDNLRISLSSVNNPHHQRQVVPFLYPKLETVLLPPEIVAPQPQNDEAHQTPGPQPPAFETLHIAPVDEDL